MSPRVEECARGDKTFIHSFISSSSSIILLVTRLLSTTTIRTRRAVQRRSDDRLGIPPPDRAYWPSHMDARGSNRGQVPPQILHITRWGIIIMLMPLSISGHRSLSLSIEPVSCFLLLADDDFGSPWRSWSLTSDASFGRNTEKTARVVARAKNPRPIIFVFYFYFHLLFVIFYFLIYFFSTDKESERERDRFA